MNVAYIGNINIVLSACNDMKQSQFSYKNVDFVIVHFRCSLSGKILLQLYATECLRMMKIMKLINMISR